LRICNRAENERNKVKQKNNTSGYKGVSWDKAGKKWCSKIRINNRLNHLGYHKDPQDAARAYDTAARELFGEFAKTNFP
jgi:hypothetical protein